MSNHTPEQKFHHDWSVIKTTEGYNVFDGRGTEIEYQTEENAQAVAGLLNTMGVRPLDSDLDEILFDLDGVIKGINRRRNRPEKEPRWALTTRGEQIGCTSCGSTCHVPGCSVCLGNKQCHLCEAGEI